MSNPNNSDNPENKEKMSKKEKVDIHSLVREAISTELGKDDIADPQVFPITDISGTTSNIRDQLKILASRREINTTPGEIDKVAEPYILSEIALFSRGLEQGRKEAPKRIKKEFPLLSSEQVNDIGQVLLSKNENELSDIYTSRTNIKRFLLDELNINPETVTRSMYDFEEIFGDSLDKQSDLYKRLQHATVQYKNNGINPPKALVRELFGVYKADNLKHKIPEICAYFGIELTLAECVRNKLIDPAKLESIAQGLFPDIWGSLEEKEKEKIFIVLRNDDSTTVSIDDLDQNKWGQYMTGNQIINLLSEKVYKSALLLEKERGIGSALSQVNMDQNGKIHQNWLDILTKKVGPKISGLQSWNKEGMVLVCRDIYNNQQYYKLIDTDVPVGSMLNPGIKIESLSGDIPGSIGKGRGGEAISYEDIEEFLIRGIKEGKIMSEEELRAKSVKDKEQAILDGGALDLKDDEKIWDTSDIESKNTIAALTEAINRIDKNPDGYKICDGIIKPGLAFLAESEEKPGESFVYEIKELDDSGITITSKAGDEGPISLSDFIEAIEKRGIERVAYIDPTNKDGSLLAGLSEFKVDSATTLEKGSLAIEKEEEVDDGHGHTHKKSVKSSYEFFKTSSGDGHIRMGTISGGDVLFYEYSGDAKLEDIQKAKKAGKLSKSKEKALYSRKVLSYGAFLQYLKKNKLEATTENLLDPHAKFHHPHEHFEGSFFSKIGKMYNIGDIIKAVSNLGHHIEHYFEKTSKLNASRLTLSITRKLGLPADLVAQAQSEEVASVKEIIQKLQDKLFNLNGPHARTKALHIAHNIDARPEEVAAAMTFMVKSYGHLYAEDIAYAQGSHSFINGFMNACGIRSEAERKKMKEKSIDKFKADLGSEQGVTPTEEEIIWGFMKTMDGKYDEYPLAATVVKAMGGPSGWEKAWRTEGYDGAYQKGIRQGGDTVNADGRVNKGLSSLITHEYASTVGFMEQAAAKDPDPMFQTIPVVWALAGYSQYISSNISQKVKVFADGKGHTFHAYSFLRNYDANEKFRKLFMLALGELVPGETKILEGYIETLQRTKHNHDPKLNDKAKDAVNGIANIWKKYQGAGLHDMLQGNNMWLIEKANAGSKEAKEYLQQLESAHIQNSKDKPPGDDSGWMDQFGYRKSPLLEQSIEKDGTILLGLKRTLDKIHLGSQNFDMDRNDEPRLWPTVLERMERVRAIKDKNLREKQYYKFRQDILIWLKRTIVTRGYSQSTLADLQKKTYYRDLLKMGIDPEVIVMDGELMKVIQKTADEDYSAWENGGRTGGTVYSKVHDQIQDVLGKEKQRGPDRGAKLNAGLDKSGSGEESYYDPRYSQGGIQDLSDG